MLSPSALRKSRSSQFRYLDNDNDESLLDGFEKAKQYEIFFPEENLDEILKGLNKNIQQSSFLRDALISDFE